MIRSATEAYNRAARALNPPRPPLDWAQVSRYSFLEEFTLLRDTQHDITKAPWADPVIYKTIKKYFRVCRARKEIQRCNVEIQRLVTSICDKARQHSKVLKALAEQKSHVFGAVSEYCLRCRCVNALLMGQIRHIFNLDGFTGSRTPGHRKSDQDVQGDEELGRYDHVDDDSESEEGEDIENDQIDGILDFVTSL